MKNLFDINHYDNLVSKELQQQTLTYVKSLEWHVNWMPQPALPGRLVNFVPEQGIDKWLTNWPTWHRTSLLRCGLATDVEDLQKHPLVLNLWNEINKGLNYQYEIDGYPEDMFDGTDGWRVYVNGSAGKATSGTWGPHRDTPNLKDETSVTILYCLNLEWYPRWGGEFVFFPEDPEGLSGDHQQFNVGEHMQQRNYNVGWPDQGKIISPVPNRVIVYDGRNIHNTNPPTILASAEPQYRLAFRARKKN
jgi:hypothetical protein